MEHPYSEVYIDFIKKVEELSKPTKVIVDIEGNGDENDKVLLFKSSTPVGDEYATLRLALGDDYKTMFYLFKMSLMQNSTTFEFQDGFDKDDPKQNIIDLVKNLTIDLESIEDVAKKMAPLDYGFAENTIKSIKDAINN